MESFIEQVRSRPCLWDMDDAGYKDFEVMEKAWIQVAEATGFQNAKTAKIQWKKLRDNFREALKRQIDSKGSGRLWRYQQQMEFLTPFMSSKNHDFSTAEGSDSNSDLHIYPLEEVKTESEDATTEPVLVRKKRKNFTQQDDVQKDMHDLGIRIQSGNPLLDFFSSMYNTTEELPLHLQLQVKRKVFEVVMEAEEAALLLQQQQQQDYDVPYFM